MQIMLIILMNVAQLYAQTFIDFISFSLFGLISEAMTWLVQNVLPKLDEGNRMLKDEWTEKFKQTSRRFREQGVSQKR